MEQETVVSSTPVLTTLNDGQILQIFEILITSETPGCSESFIQDVVLSVDAVSVAGTASADQNICIGDTPANLSLTGKHWKHSMAGLSR